MDSFSARCVLAMFVLSGLFAAGAADSRPADEAASDFIGTWHVTSGTTSFIVSIRPEGEALLILIQSGSHGIDHVTWKPVPGGLLVEGVPRFRFWSGPDATGARVAMEPLAPELTSREIQEFPLTFMMRRLDDRPRDSLSVTERSLPQGWDDPILPATWDESAGRRRNVTR